MHINIQSSNREATDAHEKVIYEKQTTKIL